jgi:hypothetical protein
VIDSYFRPLSSFTLDYCILFSCSQNHINWAFIVLYLHFTNALSRINSTAYCSLQFKDNNNINIDSYKNKLSFLGWYMLQFMSSLSYSLPALPNTLIGLYGFHDLIRSKWYSSLCDFWVELMGVWCLWGNFLCLGGIINFYIL